MPQPPQIWDVELDNGKTVAVSAATAEEASEKALAMSGGSAPPPEEEKSLAGFGSNVLSSAGEQVKNLWDMATDLPGTAKALGELGTGLIQKALPGDQPPSWKQNDPWYVPQADAALKHYADRYGSPKQLGETFYKDPAGVAMDVSTLAGGAGGGLRVLGKAGNLPKVAQAGKVLGTVEQATSPLTPVTKLANKALRGTGIGVIRSGTSPSRAVQKSFQVTPNEVARTIMDEGLVTEGQAFAKAEASKAAAKGMLQEAQAAGVAGADAVDIANDVWTKVKPVIDGFRKAGGTADETPHLIQRLDEFVNQHPNRQIALTELDKLKRLMQTKAYEPGQASNWLNKQIDRAFAEAYTKTERTRVPAVASQHRQSQKLIGAERAIREAATRSSGGQLPTAVGLGTAVGSGGAAAIPAYAATKLATLPATSRTIGIGLGGLGRGIDSATLRRMAMLRMLSEAGTPDTP